MKVLLIIALFASFNLKASDKESFLNSSGYVPTCLQKTCNRSSNIVFLGAGSGIINGYNQSLYSIGYMRIIRTKGQEDLIIGLQGLGSERDRLFGANVLVGYGW